MLSPVRRPRDLSALLRNIQVARGMVQQARRVSGEQFAARAAQRTLVGSIDAFTDELTVRGLPVPHALRAEARLYDDVLALHPR